MKKYLSDFDNATKFWAVVAYAAFIAICFASIKLAVVLSLTLSLFIGVAVMDNNREDIHRTRLLRSLAIGAYVIWAIMLCMRFCTFAYDRTIRKFNEWLNTK